MDLFASLVDRYFALTEEDVAGRYVNMDPYNMDQAFDPGIQVRLAMRTGEVPPFGTQDSTEECFAILEKLLQACATKEGGVQAMGCAIFFARLYSLGNHSDEEFGVFAKDMPRDPNPFPKDMTKTIRGFLPACRGELTKDAYNTVDDYFKEK